MIFVFIIGIAAFVALAVPYLWLCTKFRKPGLIGALGKLAVQTSLLGLVLGLLCGFTPTQFLVAAAAPPLMLFAAFDLRQFAALFAALAPYALPAAVLAASVALAMPRLRLWSPAIAIVAGFGTALIAAGPVTSQKMCETAATHAAGPILRNSFLFSLRNTRQDLQFDLHAQTTIEGQLWGWSYGTLNWYPVPARAVQNLNTPPTTLPCP